MAPPDRPGSPLIDRLHARPREFEFFQLVKLLRREVRGASLPGGPGPAKQENLRFRPAVGIGFPPGDIHAIAPIESDDDPAMPRRWRIEVNFMGLYGPSSPMPTHFSEDFMWSGGEDAARDFVDLFHHRIISFVFRAWMKYRHAEQFDAQVLDDFSRRLLCIIGLGTPGMAEGSGLRPLRLLRTSGLLADRHRSAAGLEQFLRAQFGLAALRVRPCVKHVAHVPAAQALRLGRPVARLGETAVLGERLIDLSGTFRLELGPFDVATARRFLPGSDELARLVKLARLYVSDPLNIELRLRISAPSVPPLRLTERARLGLGHLTWLSPDGRHEGQASVSLRPYDPLYQRRARPSDVPVSEPQPRPAAPAVTTRPAKTAPRTKPRVTTIRRP